ncbi:HD-GYP domain-containing protein [Pigmentibacter ruber]
MTISPFHNIDIVLIYKPFHFYLSISDITDVKLNIIENDLDEEINQKLIDHDRLKLFILKPQQYNQKFAQIQKFLNTGNNSKHIGFLLVEDPQEKCTILLRKKIEKYCKSNNIINFLKTPLAKNQFFYEVRNSIQTLFLKCSYEYLEAFSFLRDVESKAIKDLSKAMTNKSFLAKDFIDLVLKKSMEITMADAGFIFINEESFHSENKGNSASKIQNLNRPLKFYQKGKILNSQKIFLRKNYLDPSHSKVTRHLVENKIGISWFDNKNNLNPKEKIIALKKVSPLNEVDFDSKTYKIRSYCAFPILLPSGEMEGFILLINKRVSEDHILTKQYDIENYVTKFSSHDLDLLESFTNQAGIALDHSKLIYDLKKVFESFTAASITAIESRDPTTKGHSERVATLTVGLAEAVNKTSTGIYSGLEFSKIQIEEIRYASLLHDFGKIGVREHILNKEKKLFPHELENIESRFINLQDKLKINILENYINNLLLKNQAPNNIDLEKIRIEIEKTTEKLQKFYKIIQEVNEPAILSQEFFDKISEIAATKIIVGNLSFPLLTEREIEALSIKRGSLSQAERLEIESHVTHSYNFLVQIPWSSDLKDIPEIVYGHHERLDGSGYPRNLKGKNIPVQAKMMAITDIYDALVARDRPYKKAVPYERALSILESEAKAGKLDSELFRIFVDAKIGELTLDQNEIDAKINSKQTSVA